MQKVKFMKYEEYKVEDFLADPEFRNWVVSPKQSSQLFWGKWMEGHPGQKKTIESAREIILSLKFAQGEIILKEEKEDILKKLLNGQHKRLNKPRNQGSKWWNYGIAASFLLLLSLSVYLNFNSRSGNMNDHQESIVQVVKENPRGQKTKVTLPDGTMVWLNSESRIEYASAFVDKRTVRLKGEAFFEVAKDPNKPFEVYANGTLTTALGTSFNINAFSENDVEVGLVTGKISVETPTGNKKGRVYAVPGEKVIYNSQSADLLVRPYDNLDFIKWTDRIIVFKRAGFKEIKDQLERWYGVTINVSNQNKEMTFTGEFKNESLERVLERLAFVEKFSFRINEEQVNIIFD